jgi:hypothetical protein
MRKGKHYNLFIFVGYSKDVKGYGLLQTHSNDIIIRRDVKLDEVLSAYNPNSKFVPSLDYEPSLTIVPSSIPEFYASAHILVSSSDDDSEDENTPPPTHLPFGGFVEPEPKLTPQLSR